MEVTELRVGSIVNFDDDQYTVNGISQGMADEPYDVELKTKFGMFMPDVPVEELEGVRLGQEGLLKFGFLFLENRSGTQGVYTNGMMNLTLSNSGNVYRMHLLIPYEHTLQNLYSVLIGEELTTLL